MLTTTIFSIETTFHYGMHQIMRKDNSHKKTDKFYLQVALSKELAEKVNFHRRMKNFTWIEMIEPLFKKFLEDKKEK